MSWPIGLSTRLRSAVIVDGVAGSGFTTSSICPDQSFADRSGDAPAPERDLVVVQGGLNDVDAGRRELMTAVTAVVRGSRAGVVVGPAPAPVRSGQDLWRVDRILARGAHRGGAIYVSAMGWSDLEYADDDLHLAGPSHLVFGGRVARIVLRARGRLCPARLETPRHVSTFDRAVGHDRARHTTPEHVS